MGVEDAFLEAVRKHGRLLADTSAVIYFLNRVPRYEKTLRPLFHLAEQREIELVLSVVTEVELLVGPMRSGNEGAVNLIRLFLSRFSNVEVVPVSREIAHKAAQLRAESGLKLPDALIAATGVVSGCRAALGNDRSWAGMADLPFICLDDFAV
ncbi:MAG: PIN domain-containing protein [Bacillota bacterium]